MKLIELKNDESCPNCGSFNCEMESFDRPNSVGGSGTNESKTELKQNWYCYDCDDTWKKLFFLKKIEGDEYEKCFCGSNIDYNPEGETDGYDLDNETYEEEAFCSSPDCKWHNELFAVVWNCEYDCHLISDKAYIPYMRDNKIEAILA